MSDDSDWKNLKTIEKIVHKNWKSRVDGYEEAINEINSCEPFDKKLDKYLSVIAKIASDANVVALDKGVDVILLYVQRFNLNDALVTEICQKIINYGLGSSRSKTKEKACEIIKMLIEAEKQDIVMKELLKNISSKHPNVVVGCATVLKESLREFGPKIVQIKECSKILIQLFEDRDKTVRESGKELIVEMYRWVGNQVMSVQINSLKSALLKEINTEFENLPSEIPMPTRYIRSQKPKPLSSIRLKNVENNETENMCKVTDPNDLIDPIEVLSKIPSDFYDKIEAKNWKVRKEALDVIDKLTNNVKLEPGDYGDLVKILVKIISKDVNIALVILASKIVIQLSKGLRKKFSPYAICTIQACLDKFKEKKATVAKSLRECVDSIYGTTSLDSITPTIIDSLTNKNPTVKLETVLFMNRLFLKSPRETITKKILKQLIPSIVRLSLDNNVDVREGSFLFLGTAMKLLSVNIISPFLDGIDSVRMSRINYFFDKEEQENIPEKVQVAFPNPEPINVSERKKQFSFVDDMHSICDLDKLQKLNNVVDDNNLCFQTEVIHNSFDESPDLVEVSPCAPRQRKDIAIDTVVTDAVEVEDDFDELSVANCSDLEDSSGDPDLFKNLEESIMISENQHIEHHKSNIMFYERLETMISKRDILLHDPVKNLIVSIFNTDIHVSNVSICVFLDQKTVDDCVILEDPSFFTEYSPLLMIVAIKQLSLIIDQLSNFDSAIVEYCGYCIHNLLGIIIHIMDEDREPLFINENIIETLLSVFVKVVDCEQLTTVSANQTLIAQIRALACSLCDRTRHLSIADSVHYFTSYICASHSIPSYLFQDVNVDNYLDTLHEAYLELPSNVTMELKSIEDHDEQLNVDFFANTLSRINLLREETGLDPMPDLADFL